MKFCYGVLVIFKILLVRWDPLNLVTPGNCGSVHAWVTPGLQWLQACSIVTQGSCPPIERDSEAHSMHGTTGGYDERGSEPAKPLGFNFLL